MASPRPRWGFAVILASVEKLRTDPLDAAEERLLWEGLAASCAPPIRRLGAFLLVGFAAFTAIMTAVILFYNLFGARPVEGQGAVSVPQEAFYATMVLSLALALGGYAVWLSRSLSSYASFAGILRRSGLDPKRPTVEGLRAYSDEQLLALRSRYQKLRDRRLSSLFERTFGFYEGDSFALGPLSVLPNTFEMNALRVDWESNLILRSAEPMPGISWWTEGRMGLLPRRADDTRRLIFALRYTGDSVRELKRRYGYRTDRWHATVPEGKLWDAIRDLENARRIQTALSRRPRSD
jgi:hypothetical protein